MFFQKKSTKTDLELDEFEKQDINSKSQQAIS